LAHELGHLVLHAALSKDMIKNDYKKVEREANLFASSFLLPKESFGKVMIMPGLDYFIQLKQEWKISIAAMIYRCKELGMINAQRSGRLQIQIFKKKWRDKEPLDNEIEFEYPAFLLDLAHKYLNNKNNVERFVNLTRLPVSDVERLCLLPDGYFVGYGVGHAIQSGYRQLSLFGRD
jgi:Zn-dependent peptidase ImmA (M78 family)